jgi:hypothetical protein
MAKFSINNEIRQHIQAKYTEWRTKILAYDLEEEVLKKKHEILLGEYVIEDGKGGYIYPEIEVNQADLNKFKTAFEANAWRIKQGIEYLQANEYQAVIDEYVTQITTLLKKIKGIVPSQMLLFWHYYLSEEANLHAYPVQEILFSDKTGTYHVQNHDFTSDAVYHLSVAKDLQILITREWEGSYGYINMDFVYELVHTFYQLHFLCIAEAFAHPTIIKKITKQKNLVLPFKVAVQIYSSDTDFVIFELNQQP